MPDVLTALKVKHQEPDATRRLEIPDGALPGFYLVVQSSGKKSFAVRYRAGSKTRKLTLSPPYPALDLAGAREKAQEALREISQGGDPAQDKRRRRPTGDSPPKDLVSDVVAKFLQRHVRRNGLRSAHEIERLFAHDILPAWGDRRIEEITRANVRDLLNGMVDRGIGSMTNRVFSLVRKLFNWAVEEDIVAVSPCARMRAPVPETSRDRVLSDQEVRWLWKASSSLGYPFGPLTRLLLLTGQRLGEVSKMTWAEVDPAKRLWTIPRERAKNDVAYEVPLSDAAMALIDALPRIVSQKRFLFTTTGTTAASGFSRAKANMDAAMLALARSEGSDQDAIPNWTFHDLRRSAASGMARLGINLPVIEKVLNHTSGSFRGVVGVYQRHSFSDEKRQALEAWARFVLTLVEDQPANVGPLQARA